GMSGDELALERQQVLVALLREAGRQRPLHRDPGEELVANQRQRKIYGERGRKKHREQYTPVSRIVSQHHLFTLARIDRYSLHENAAHLGLRVVAACRQVELALA